MATKGLNPGALCTDFLCIGGASVGKKKMRPSEVMISLCPWTSQKLGFNSDPTPCSLCELDKVTLLSVLYLSKLLRGGEITWRKGSVDSGHLIIVAISNNTNKS